MSTEAGEVHFLPLRYTGLKRELENPIWAITTSTARTQGRLTGGSIPAEVVYGARKMEAR
ncbi:MAG TPA: hypothetical protein VGV57_13495 [Thermoleophilaceae bacterium]|nr:hypothetical protein [Thermoleophilaceae bacterium]